MTSVSTLDNTVVAVPTERKFRFAAAVEGNREEKGIRNFIKLAQEAEEVGYDTFVLPDHLGDMVGPIAALGALSQATSTIRLGTAVLSNGLRHPAVLAKELATIDQLSKGRLEVGLGAGINRDYDKVNIPFEESQQRFRKFKESFHILDGLLRAQEVNFTGEFYSINGLISSPRPRQGPRPPILIGAGGPAMLKFAAQNADIVSIAVPATPDGKMLLSEMTMESTLHRVDLVKKAAGKRFTDIELAWSFAFVVITDNRERMAKTAVDAIEHQMGEMSEYIVVDRMLTPEDILQSPYLAIGTFDEIAEHVVNIRKQTSMSYVGVFPTQVENFTPIVQMLKGT